MANQEAGSSSSSTPQPQDHEIQVQLQQEEEEEEEEEEELLSIYGAELGWVEARTSCDHLHLASLPSDLAHIPTPDTPCYRCQHPNENWLCLCCKDVPCSRFVTSICCSIFNSQIIAWHSATVFCQFGVSPAMPI